MRHYARVLTIAGSDSGGGAGVQADLKTFSALGCFGMSVITALTAQNTQTVTGIHPVPPEFIALQIDTVLDDIGVDVVKIGMLHSSEVIRTVSQCLRRHQVAKIVLDPVMIAKGGSKLLQDEAVAALREELIPLSTVITPNLPEASVLLGRKVQRLEEMPGAAGELAALGPKAVLVKGGHLQEQRSPDYLYLQGGEQLFLEAERVVTHNSHGTGCTLASAIAAHLAHGRGIVEAVREAKAYLTGALKAGAEYQLGNGHGPVHHFYAFWE